MVTTIVISALAGAGVALAVNNFSSAPQTPQTNPELAKRVSKLESQLLQEREARDQLRSLLVARSTPIQNSGQDRQVLEQNAVDKVDSEDFVVPEATLENFSVTEGLQAESRREARKRALIKGGFDETEANWVLNSEGQVQLEELFAQHQMRRAALAKESDDNNSWLNRTSRQDRLREKLGEESFEKYLKANGWPTSASVQNVLTGSPAEQAGLKAGDKITSYAGERVFNLRDVNRLTLQGAEGDSVLIEVERDGNKVQVTLPRGPIGVSGG